MDKLIEAVGKLVKAKGRFHTEQNYKALVEAYDEALAERASNPASPAPTDKEMRHALHIVAEARKLGWDENGAEGAWEFVTRSAYATGWGDRGPASPAPVAASDEQHAEFAEYFTTNYRAGTVISNPAWHAPRLLRAAARALSTAPQAQAAQQPAHIELGHGAITVAQGNHAGLPAILFGRNGTGTVGEESEGDRFMEPGECLCAITFTNGKSIGVVEEKLAELRARIWPEAAATPAAPVAPSEQDSKDAARWRETVKHIGGTWTDVGAQRFTLRFLSPVEGANIMQGSVAEHFTQAIDALLPAAPAAPDEG